MTFNDLKLGMKFKLYDEDYGEYFVTCKIVKINKDFKFISVDFDDFNNITVYGHYDKPIYKFMEFIK